MPQYHDSVLQSSLSAPCYNGTTAFMLTHEVFSTLRRATCGMQSTPELRHSYLVVVAYEASSSLRKQHGNNYGMQSAMEL